MSSWRTAAKCRDRDASEFIIYRVEKRKVVDIDPPSEIKRLCIDCPVRAECLDHALLHREHGWWAGTNFQTREQLRRERA